MTAFIKPKIRFEEYTKGFESKTLNDLAHIYDGTHQTPVYVDTGVPFYSVEHLTANQFEKVKYISEEIFLKEIKRVRIERNNILMTRIGDIGTVKYINWDVKASFYVSLSLIKAKEIINSLFLSFLIQSTSFRKQLWTKTIHVAFPKKINLGEIAKCIALFPQDILEQQKIASFLSSVDKKIELLTKKHELLEKYKKRLMQKLFAQEMRFKQDDGSDFPDWKIGILDNLIKKIADGGTPPTNDKSNFGGEINWVVIDDIQDKIEVTKIKLTEKGYKKCSSSLWEPEDIILSTGATIGEVGITKLTTATKQGICGIKVNKECCNIFLKEWFKSENARLQFKKYAQGSSIKEVRPPTLIKFKIIFPELAEQQKIASFLSALDKKLDLVKQQIEKTQTFKKGLLQQMFV